MQNDEEIGRMVASVPVAVGRAMEHFAEKLLEASALSIQSSSSRTLSPCHMFFLFFVYITLIAHSGLCIICSFKTVVKVKNCDY